MTPDSSRPVRFLLWLLRLRPWPIVAAAVFGSLWMVPTALIPLAVGRAIDEGIAGGDGDTLLRWVVIVLGLAVLQAVSGGLLHCAATTMWMHAAGTTQRVVLRHVARLGGTVTKQVRAGEVVAVGSSDIWAIGNAFEVVGRLVGGLVSFAVVAVALLGESVTLGVVVLIGVPLAVAGLGPLLGPHRRRSGKHREEVGAATARAADIVSGLRILRGIGGERQFVDRFAETSQRVRRAGVSVGRIDAWLSGIEVLLPGLVTVLITWLGARLALDGVITVGELVAFYGASAFLVIPVSTATEATHSMVEAHVAAGRVCRLLRLRPELASPPRPRPLPPSSFGLHDETSGLRIPGGRLTVVDAPGVGHELADRLARHADPADGARVLADDVPLAEADLDEVRARILLAHNQDVLFSGPLRDEVAVGDRVELDTVLWAADAMDVVDGLPNGLDEVLDERGRSLSGGQRQRLMLARALSADPDVLVLDEPTSAVDAHTEARIVERVAKVRRGRTTIVLTESPLWRSVADETLSLRDGRMAHG